MIICVGSVVIFTEIELYLLLDILEPKREKQPSASIGTHSTLHENVIANSGSGLLNTNISMIARSGNDQGELQSFYTIFV